MWYKTKEGVEVFNTKGEDGYFYQLTNENPVPGDYVFVSVEHDPEHIVLVKSFDESNEYPLNGNCRYGAIPIQEPDYIRFYGAGKINWTDNPNLEGGYFRGRTERFSYYVQKHPELTLEDF